MLTRRDFLKIAGLTSFAALPISILYPRAQAIFYVAENGSDNNDGLSHRTPWKTLAKVESSLPARSRVRFRRGDTWNVKGNGTALFTIPNSSIVIEDYGEGENPPAFDGNGNIRTLFSILPGIYGTLTRNVKLFNAGGGTGALWSNSGSGINYLEDSELDTHLSDAGGASGIGSYSIVRGCNIHDCFDDGWTNHGLNGVGAGVEIYNSIIHHCFDGLNHSVTNGGQVTTLCKNVIFYSNSSHDIGPLSTGIHTFDYCLFGLPGETQSLAVGGRDSEDQIVTFNYCIVNARESNGNASPSLAGGNYNNCTFVGNPAISGKTGTFAANNYPVILKNCILSEWFRCTSGDMGSADHGLHHNLFVKNLASNTNEVGTDDPLFVNANEGDFRITASSPARGAGTTYEGQLEFDYYGNPIQNPPSVGACEYIP